MLEQFGRFLNLEWTYRENDAPSEASQEENADVVLPSRDVAHNLLELTKDGRLQDVLEVVNTLRQDNPQLRPWLRTIQQLADDFEIDNLLARLEADLAAITKEAAR